MRSPRFRIYVSTRGIRAGFSLLVGFFSFFFSVFRFRFRK